MLSSTQHIRNSCSRQTIGLLSSAKLQLRFASHSSKSDTILSNLLTKRKVADGVNKVPTHILPSPSSIKHSNELNQLKFLNQSTSSFSRFDSPASSLKILADSNNGNDDKPPLGSPVISRKKDNTTKENDQESDDKKTPETTKKEKTKDTDVTDEPSSKSKKSSGKSKSSESKSPKSTSSKSSSSSPKPKTPPPASANNQQNNPESLFTSASAADKKQVLILPINRRPLIPGMFYSSTFCCFNLQTYFLN